MTPIPIQRCRGFALMLAIFMIVTLAAIALYLVTVSTGQSQAASQDEQAVRAYQAARAGIDWDAFQLLRNGSCTAAQPPAFTAPGLSGFRVEVACQQLLPLAGETEGGINVKIYRITATGCNANPCTPAAPSPTYVERQLQLTLTREF